MPEEAQAATRATRTTPQPGPMVAPVPRMAFATNYRAAEDAKFWMGVCQLEQNMLESANETLEAYWRRYQEGGKWTPQAGSVAGHGFGQVRQIRRWPCNKSTTRAESSRRTMSGALTFELSREPLACGPRCGQSPANNTTTPQPPPTKEKPIAQPVPTAAPAKPCACHARGRGTPRPKAAKAPASTEK